MAVGHALLEFAPAVSFHSSWSCALIACMVAAASYKSSITSNLGCMSCRKALGYTYDGLYNVHSATMETNDEGFQECRYACTRSDSPKSACPRQKPAF